MSFREGDSVQWNWGNGVGCGKVKKVYTQRITRMIKGAEVTRNASEDQPAYWIEQANGDTVLKSASELSQAGSSS